MSLKLLITFNIFLTNEFHFHFTTLIQMVPGFSLLQIHGRGKVYSLPEQHTTEPRNCAGL